MSAIQRLAQSCRCSGGQLTDGTARRIGKTAWGGSGAGVVCLKKRPSAARGWVIRDQSFSRARMLMIDRAVHLPPRGDGRRRSLSAFAGVRALASELGIVAKAD